LSYPGSPPATPPTPPAPTRRGRIPVWLPIAAGVAVVAVAVAVVVTVRDRGTRAATTTTTPVVTTTTTGSTTSTTTTSTTTTSTTLPNLEAGGSWTVLVYGLGDNNLEPNLLIDMEEMAAVPAAALEFVVLADRTPDYTDRELPGIGDWDTAKLISITPGTFVEHDDLGELNLGDPQVLADFVARGIRDFPADHYALILWNHGSIAGVGSDESHGDGLTVPEVAAGLRAGLAATGLDRIDLIGFDACLMGAFEVAAAVTGLADYMVASEEVEPLDGWDYAAFGLLAADPDGVTARSLGEEIVARYMATSGQDDPTLTLSLLDLSPMPELVAALDTLRGAVAPEMAAMAPAIGRGRSSAPSFGGSPLPEEDFYMVDLGDLLTRWSSHDAPLGDAAAAALAVFDRVVIASQAGPARAGATGLAVYFPPFADYYAESWYRTTQAPVWPDFLDSYYAAGQEIPPEAQPSFAPVDNEAASFFNDFGLNVQAIFDDGSVDNIVAAFLYTGVVGDDGTVTFIGEDQGLFAGNQAVASNSLTRLVLDDGQDQAYAFQDISFSEDFNLITLDVPLAYYPPGVPPGGSDYRDITLKLTYDVAADRFSEGFYATDQFGTISQFAADPEGLLVPWMLTWRPDGTIEWVQTSDVGLWADLPSLLYDFEKLPVGTELYAELYVYDFGGNSDYAAVRTQVPAAEAPWASCANPAWGYEVSYPGGWFVWDSPDPGLDCAYFDPASMEGLTEAQAFDQAALTVEVYQGDALVEAISFLQVGSVTVEEAAVGGRPATLYESAPGEWGFRAFVVPLGPGPGDPALVVAAWGSVGPSLTELADRVAREMVIGG